MRCTKRGGRPRLAIRALTRVSGCPTAFGCVVVALAPQGSGGIQPAFILSQGFPAYPVPPFISPSFANGDNIDSTVFARHLGRWRDQSVANTIFMIGGADDQVWPSCDLMKISMDRLQANGHTSKYADDAQCYPDSGPFSGGLPGQKARQRDEGVISAGHRGFLACCSIALV